jgi:hypothetical protein
MRRIARTLSVAAAGLWGSALVAQDAFDGQHMKKACGDYLVAAKDAAASTNSGSFESGRCAGFVQGAVAAHALDLAVARARTGHASSRICIPESTTLTDEVRAFHAYLTANPSKLDNPGIDLLYAALLDAFPCGERPAR